MKTTRPLKEVRIVADASQYAKDMEYLMGLRQVDRSNRIYQKLNGKRNIPEVDSFLNSKIEPKAFGS